MDLDLIIYGRGQERLEGYQTFTAPYYWTDDMLTAMSTFSHMWSNGDLSDAYPEKFTHSDPWGRTYIFIAMPSPYCCALLRTTRVEGDAAGEWLKEVRNKEIWSLEGVCAPFERKEEFFAHIPSIILWLERDKGSLYKKFRSGAVSPTFNIPDELMITPYDDSTDTEKFRDILSDSFDAWDMLRNKIRCSNGMFHFLFGPFSECFFNSLRAPYNITEIFPTECRKEAVHDPFEDMTFISRKTRAGVQKQHRLRIITDTGDMPRRCWQLYSPDSSDPADVLTSEPPFPIPENGIDVRRMLSETETIRLFTSKMQWETADSLFSFIEEV